MKKRVFKLFFIVIVTFFFGCKGSNGEKIEDVTRIDMIMAEAVIFDSLITNIEYTRLQKDNFPPFNYCKKMIRYQDMYYILVSNLGGDEILIFRDSGEFIRRITFDGEFFFLSTLLISPDEKELWIICDPSTLKKYELDGAYKQTIVLPFPIADIISAGNLQQFLIYEGGFNREWDHSFALTDLSATPEKFYIRKERKFSQYIPQSLFAASSINEDIFILPKQNDTIYLYHRPKKTVKPYYFLDFHGDFLTEQMAPKNGWSDKEMNDIITERKYIYSVNGFYQVANKLFFKLEGKHNSFYTIDLKDDKVGKFDHLFDGYIPDNYFIGSDNNNLFIMIREYSIVRHYEKNKCTYPALQELLSSITPNENSWLLLKIGIK